MRKSQPHTFIRLLLVLLFLSRAVGSSAQAVNDFGAISSGSWTTASIWRQWDGVGWNTVPAAFPNGSTQNVYILAGSTVTLPAPGPYNIGRITVETGGKLFCNSIATNVYLSVWGSNIICNGEIGNGAIFDGIGFNFEATTTTISGLGTFTASRFRKSAVTNPTTALVIAMNVTLRWDQASNTQLYNNTSAASLFNVTVNAGYTLNCAGSAASPGNVAIDGINGTGTAEAGGTITVNGTLIVPGILYATTNDTTNACNFTIGNGGVIKANAIHSPASAKARMRFQVLAGGRLELTGTTGFPAGTANFVSTAASFNSYDFALSSTVEYSAPGNQSVLTQNDFTSSGGVQSQYGSLVASGTGIKTIRVGTLSVRANLTITGQAVLDQEVNDPNILVSGNWFNYNQIGFTESTNTTRYVQFNTTSTNPVAVATITCPGGEEFFNLLISKTLANSRVQMQHPVTVRNQLTLGGASSSGILELNENALNINNPDSAAIKLQGNAGYLRYIIAEDSSGASASRVNWNIGSNTGLYIIPFGINSSLDTIPFAFYKPVSGNIGTLSIATYGTPPSNLPWPTAAPAVSQLNSYIPVNNTPDNRDWTVDRFWYLGATSPIPGCSAAFVYNIRPSTPSELPVNEPDPAALKAQYWDPTLAAWYLPQLGFGPPFPLPFPPILTIGGVAVPDLPVYNTHYTLSSVSSPLPVELLNFEAKPAASRVDLNWTTASETGNDHFEIERSDDGNTFTRIGTVSGAGNSTSVRQYSFNDAAPLRGISYYRLRQVDFDGGFTFSDIQAVNMRLLVKGHPYPMPASSEVFFEAESTDYQLLVRYEVISSEGHPVLAGVSQHALGLHRISTSALNPGSYILRLDDGLTQRSFPLLIVR